MTTCYGFIDYKKAFDSVPHAWLVEVLQNYKIHLNIVNFFPTIKKGWRTNFHLQINSNYASADEIDRWIYHVGWQSPLSFCFTVLNDPEYCLKIKANGNTSYIASLVLYMDDIKLYLWKDLFGNNPQIFQ